MHSSPPRSAARSRSARTTSSSVWRRRWRRRCRTAPSWCSGFGPNGQRWSVIPHRTLSHSPYPYLVLLVIGLLLPPVATPIGVVALGNVVAGVGAGALIHLALDVLSPSGVPLLNPFGRRTSLGPNLSGGHPYLYRTSTAEEWPILLPFAILLAVDVGAIALNVALNGLPDPRLLLGWLRA